MCGGTNSFIYKNSGFDYRPFVLNWCMTVKVIDGFSVNPIESLKAEWLYSQGRGRQFRIGEQEELAKYLSSVCPLTGEALENEEDRKLRLILSKAQQHQRQLKEEISGMFITKNLLLCLSCLEFDFSSLYKQKIQIPRQIIRRRIDGGVEIEYNRQEVIFQTYFVI